MAPPSDPRPPALWPEFLPVTVELCAAIALLDQPLPRAWQRCRTAALRYVEASRASGLGPSFAIASLRRAIDVWAPHALPADRRAQLDARVPFWVGTVYGLRWQHGRAPTSDVLPPPGQWERLRAWRGALAERRRELHHRRTLLGREVAARLRRSRELCAITAQCVSEARRLRAELDATPPAAFVAR